MMMMMLYYAMRWEFGFLVLLILSKLMLLILSKLVLLILINKRKDEVRSGVLFYDVR